VREPVASSLTHRARLTHRDILASNGFEHAFAITEVGIDGVVDSQDLVGGVGVDPVAILFVQSTCLGAECVDVPRVRVVSVECAIAALGLSHSSSNEIRLFGVSCVDKSREVEGSTFLRVVWWQFRAGSWTIIALPSTVRVCYVGWIAF